MSSYVAGPTFTERVAAGLAQYLRVKYDGSFKLVVAGDEQHIGQTSVATTKADEPVAVIGVGQQSTGKYVAAGAFAKGATITSAGGGKVDDAAGSITIGIAREAAAADGDIVEVIHI